jgi:prepilin peptidase CpaA
MTLSEGAVLSVAAAACVWDLRTSRIPNALTFGAAGAALLYGLLTAGLGGLGAAAGGWLVGCALFIPFFFLGGMGAGDVKLLAALGAWLGPHTAVWVALYAGVAGGPLAIVAALVKGKLRESLTNLWCLLMFWRVGGIRPMPGLTLRTAQSPRLPYALPIAAGAAVALWLR